MSEVDRAEAMARRLSASAARAGIDDAGIGRLDAAYRLAMEPRHARLDDHDPDYLHPGRTAVILLEDIGVADPDVLAAAVLCETLRPDLAVDRGAAGRAAGPAAAALFDAVPVPARAGEARLEELLAADEPVPGRAGEALLEELLAADEPVRLIALAERLDHARHLHLRPRAEWQPIHRETCHAYLPVADRTHPTFARRYRWWCGMFERRYLGADRAR